MIFYTVQGPSYKLEIHDDHLRLVKKSWFNLVTKQRPVEAWEIQNLSRFEISVPKLIWGKLEWEDFQGVKGSFRFTTTPAMVKKIETYLQKRVLKNHQQAAAAKKAAPQADILHMTKAQRKKAKRESRAA